MPTVTRKRGPKISPAEIKRIRTRLGLTQAQAAERVGVTVRTWNSWECARDVPAIQSVMLLRMLSEGKI